MQNTKTNITRFRTQKIKERTTMWFINQAGIVSVKSVAHRNLRGPVRDPPDHDVGIGHSSIWGNPHTNPTSRISVKLKE